MLGLHRMPRTAPSPLVGEGRGGGDGRTTAVGIPPTPSPSPQGGGGSVGAKHKVQRHSREGGNPGHASAWVRCRLLAALASIALVLALTPAHAVQPDEVLKDPALEARARSISQELRCLVCQNQSIDDSNAELARDLRVIVRERIAAGDSDGQVLAFVEKRYGEFVLLRPRLAPHTLVLWLAPLLLLLGAAAVLFRRARWRPASGGDAREPAALTPAEQKRLDELLAQGDR